MKCWVNQVEKDEEQGLKNFQEEMLWNGSSSVQKIKLNLIY